MLSAFVRFAQRPTYSSSRVLMKIRTVSKALVVVAGSAAAIAGYTRGLSPKELGIAAATVLGMLLLTTLARYFEGSRAITGKQTRAATLVLMWTAVGAGVYGTVLLLVWATSAVLSESRLIRDGSSQSPSVIDRDNSSPA